MNPRARTWLRRAGWTVGALAGARLLLAVGLAPAASWIANTQGLNLAWDSHELSLSGGEVRLTGLRIAKAGEAQPAFVTIESLHADVDLRALLDGRLVVTQVVVDSPIARAGLDAQGAFRLAGDFDPLSLLGETTATEEPITAEPPSLPTSVPVAVEHLRVRHAKLVWTDAGLASAPTVVDLDVEGSQLFVPYTSGSLRVRVGAAGLLDSVRVDCGIQVIRDDVETATTLAVDAQLAGLRLRPLAEHLRRVGIVARGERMDGAVQLELSLSGRNEQATQVATRLQVRQARLTADGRTALAVEAVDVDLQASLDALRSQRLAVVAPYAYAELAADGVPVFAGLGFVGAPQVSTVPSATAAVTQEPSKQLHAALAVFELERGRIEFIDRRVEPPQDIGLDARRIVLKNLDSAVLTASLPVAPEIELSAVLGVDEVANELLADGKVRVEETAAGDPRLGATLTLQGDEVSLAAWSRLLGTMGLAPTPRPTDLRASFRAVVERGADDSWTASAEIAELSADDGLHRVSAGATQVNNLRVAEGAQGLSIVLPNVSLDGALVMVRRTAEGDLVLPLVTVLAQPSPTSAPKSATAGSTAGTAPNVGPVTLPNLQLDRLALRAQRLRLLDEFVSPPVELELVEAQVELLELRTGSAVPAGAQPGATLKMSMQAPGLLKQAALEGALSVSPDLGRTKSKFQLSAEGVDLSKLQVYLTPLGIEALVRNGQAQATVQVETLVGGGQFQLSASAKDVSWSEGEANYARLDTLALDGLVLDAEGIRIADVIVRGGHTAVERDSQGRWSALGIRVDPSKLPDTTAAPAEAPSAPKEAQPAPLVRIAHVLVETTGVTLVDAAVTPATTAELAVQMEVSDLATGGSAQTRVSGTLGLAPLLRRASLDALLQLAPTALTAQAQVDFEGLDTVALEPWLPAAVRGEARALAGQARIGALVDWSQGLSIAFDALRVGLQNTPEGAVPQTLAAVQQVSVVVPKLEPTNIRIDQVLVAEAQLSIERDAQGALHTCGVVLQPGTGTSADAASAPAPAAPAQPVVIKLANLPRVEIATLSLDLGALNYRDAQLGAPIELGVRVQLVQPWVACSPKEGEATPLVLQAQGRLLPLVREWSAQLQAGLIQQEPSLALTVEAKGIEGNALVGLVPALAGQINGGSLTDASFQTGLQARVKFPRRSHYEFDLTNGLSGELTVQPTRLAMGDRTLLGVDGVRAELRRFVPHTGFVHVPRISVQTPRLSIVRQGDQVEVAGLTVNLAAPTNAEASTPASVPAAASVSTPAPLPEIRVDAFEVDGLAVDIRDAGADPVTYVPLRNLDLSVRRFTTRMLTEPRAMRFSMALGSEKAPLPRRHGVKNAVLGIVQAAKASLAGQKDELVYEDRELLEEFALSGRLQLFPEPNAQVQMNLSALELLGVRGTAAAQGVNIGDGLMDFALRARLVGDKLSVQSTAVFTDLSLSEPKAGPIETYLAIPMPLDAALFLLKNAEGELRIPVSLSASTKGITTADLAMAGGGAVAKVIGTAIASAPLRVLGTFTDLFSDAKSMPKTDAARLAFVPGTVAVDSASRAALEPMFRRLQSDPTLVAVIQHRLSVDDMQRMDMLANPAQVDVEELQARLRQRRRELLREHAEIAARARASQGSWRGAVVDELRTRWREVDGELGTIEHALDEVGELLQPGADRYRDKRTRSAALELSERRLESVRELLQTARADDGVAVEMRTPALQVAGDETGGTVLIVLRKR